MTPDVALRVIAILAACISVTCATIALILLVTVLWRDDD